MARIQREVGATTLDVTHDQVEAMTIGDPVAVLRKEELHRVHTPQRLDTSLLHFFDLETEPAVA